MGIIALPTNGPALVARSLPDRSTIADARIFAWEILRCRVDYRETAATIEQIGSPDAPIELILPHEDASAWGLRFH